MKKKQVLAASGASRQRSGSISLPVKFVLAVFVALATVIITTPVQAADLTVGSAAGETYNVSGSESYGEITVGNINEIGTLNIGSGASLTATGTTFFGTGGGDGTLNITLGGQFSTNKTWIGVSNGSIGKVTLSGSGSKWTEIDAISLGSYETGTGSLTISDGATLDTHLLGIGDSPWASGGTGTGSGYVTVTGSQTNLISTGGIDIGRYAGSPGELTVNGGATVTTGDDSGGVYMGAGGTLTVSGSGTTFDNTNPNWITDSSQRAWIGMDGGNAVFSDGATIISDGGYVGSGGSDAAHMTVTGSGTTWLSKVRVYVGGSTGGSGAGIGYLTISDGAKVTSATGGAGLDDSSQGTIVITGSGSSFSAEANSDLSALGNFYVSYAGTSNVLVTKGALLNADNHISVAAVAGSTGTLAIGAAKGSAAAAPGTITTPSVDFGDGTGTLVFNHTSSNYDFTPDITGAGSVDLYAGTTRFSGDLTGFTGTLNVDGGTLFVPNGQTLSISGDYHQASDGTLKIATLSSSDTTRASGTVDYGKISVTGTATFDAGTSINVDLSSMDKLAVGESITGVISAGTLNVSSFTLTDNSKLFKFVGTVNGNSVDLDLVQDTTVSDIIGNAGLSAASGAAGALDSVISSGATNGDFDTVITALGRMDTDQQIKSAIVQLMPVLVTGTADIAATNVRTVGQTIRKHQNGYADAETTDKGVWVIPLGNWAHQFRLDGVSGYKTENYGVVAGVDKNVSSSSRVGFAFSYMNNSVLGTDTADGNHVDIDAYQATVYGSHELKAYPGLKADWQLDAGYNNNDESRKISFMNRTATAEYNSYTGHAGAGLGRDFSLGAETTVTPGIRADYIYVRDKGYTESGAGAIDLKVDSNDTQDFIMMAETRLNHSYNDRVNLVANIGAGYDMINQRPKLTASYTGGGPSFTTSGLKTSPWLGQGGLGMVYKVSGSTNLSANFDLEARENYLSQTASLNLKWLF